jgi:hypothetical protein
MEFIRCASPWLVRVVIAHPKASTANLAHLYEQDTRLPGFPALAIQTKNQAYAKTDGLATKAGITTSGYRSLHPMGITRPYLLVKT